ncbi:hypothetical protein [Bradyrhizobium sp. CCBAU 45389]|uniref:hypothetical protein n=1 Tax=Bradyrhizobium sp. CCBAU 45389 TaxID=858429 RepID=UPI002306C760|nr:hypothetical protein [Bradyrhizobium sp. CCBAU 45389]
MLPSKGANLARHDFKRSVTMIRLFAVAGFALAIATSTQAMPLAPIQSDDLITQQRR